jgi:phosphohistidine phosphatase SixA
MGTKAFTSYWIGRKPTRPGKSPTFDQSFWEARMMGSLTKRRQGIVWLGILVVLGVGAAWTTSRAQDPDTKGSSGRPKQVLIIRHAEKPDDSSDDAEARDRGLSTRGHERAAALAYDIRATFLKPDFLFATEDSPHSKRPVDTIKPLAQRLKLEINQDYPDDKYCELAKEILNNPKYTGKRILICWHHGTLPDLAAALKAPVPPDKRKWPGKVFDRVWQLDYSGGEVTLTDLPQRWLYGDSSN